MTRELRRLARLLTVFMLGLALWPIGVAVAQESSSEGGSLLESLDLPVLEITITDDGVAAPDSFEAGVVLLQLNNTASTPVSFALVDPPDGITGEAVAANFAEPVLDTWWADAIVPVAHDAMPGQTVKIAVQLGPGEFEIVAISGGAEEMSAAAPIGNVSMTVTGALAADAGDAIESAATLEFGQYAFAIHGAIPAGPAIVKVTNPHVVPHHAVIFTTDKLYDHEEAHAGVMSLLQGTPAADGSFNLGDGPPALVTPALGGGAAVWIEVDFQPGFYAAVCFLADPGQEVPHVMMGMIQVFEVAG